MRLLRSTLVALAAFVLGAFVPPASNAKKLPDSPVSAKRDTEPVVIKGSALGSWSVPANQTVKLPFMDLAGTDKCSTSVGPPDPNAIHPEIPNPTSGGVGIPDPGPSTGGAITYDPNACPPQDYAKPDVDTAAAQNGVLAGTDVARILGYRWDKKAGQWRQIPVQVDEVFTRYLDNSRSGFALYSGQDQHTTYAYDREGFRYTDNAADDPCQAIPRMVNGVRLKALPDPVPGLDNNDEIAFMYSDAGPRAPVGTALPDGIVDAQLVTVADPFGTSKPKSVYLMRAALVDGATPKYTAANGYVSYKRDANADRFAYSQSSYGDYGNAPKGTYCDPDTGKVKGTGQRRPIDTATIATRRYRFRYDGRWLLTKIEISDDAGKSYGPDLVDRWKARAFAQDPSSNTPCCGYEEEDSNWGGSSITLGEKVGPVRAIRETWGADSGTNVIRRETFYRDEMRQKTWLRVHVIPPLDGIYSQWDFNAGRVAKFFNPRSAAVKPAGWDIDGRNDEVFGNLDDPCNDNYNADDGMDKLRPIYRMPWQYIKGGGYSWCNPDDQDHAFPYHQSVDLPDPTVSDANASLSWSEVTGDYGTIVDRTSATIEDLSPAGAAQSVLAVPYYRDDACFDDGTGSDPGRELFPRDADNEKKSGLNGARSCWRGTPAVPGGDPKYWQGSIATHGLHILFLADSDNARQTVPVSEIVAETRMVMLPGKRDGSVGEQYGRGFEKQLGVAALPTIAGLSTPGRKGSDDAGNTEPGQTPAPQQQGSPGADQGGGASGGGSGTSQSPGSPATEPATSGDDKQPAKAEQKHKAKKKHKAGHKKHKAKKHKKKHRKHRS
jgi:hypothetical protein